jgi:hypothetical protein
MGGLATPPISDNGNSRKFAVASGPSGAAAGTEQRHGGTPSAPKRGGYVPFVAPLCIKGLRLATALLPEKSLSLRRDAPSVVSIHTTLGCIYGGADKSRSRGSASVLRGEEG